MSGVKGRSGGKRPGAGRSTFKPTEEQRELVNQLAVFGLRHCEICTLIKDPSGTPISDKTMRKHFPDELSTGKLKANLRVMQTLYKKAIAGDTASIIFWLKAQAGWRDSQRVELSGPNNGPIQNVAMSVAEFQAEARKIAQEI